MANFYGLKARMYITLSLILAIGFAIIYILLLLLGASSFGIIIFAALYFAFQWYISPKAIALFSHLRYIGEDEYPKLHKIVRDLAAQAQVPTPRIAISPSKEPNAFVFGRTRKGATLAVHKGLLDIVDEDELRAVLAHEIGHIKHNDFAVMTFISFIPMLAMLIAQNMFFYGAFGGNRQNGGALALVGIGAFLIYIVTELFSLGLSRTRELYADYYSASATKKPEDLARALVKITYGQAHAQQSPVPQAARSLYIADGLHARNELSELSKHISELSKLLGREEIERLKEGIAKERSSFLLGIFSTHPSTYTRLMLLAKAEGELNSNQGS